MKYAKKNIDRYIHKKSDKKISNHHIYKTNIIPKKSGTH